MKHFIDLMLWGTGGPLMYVALGLALLTVVFHKMAKDWAANLTEVPLNYISESRYRTPKPMMMSATPMFATSAISLTASVGYHPGAVWPVEIPYLDRLPGVAS